MQRQVRSLLVGPTIAECYPTLGVGVLSGLGRADPGAISPALRAGDPSDDDGWLNVLLRNVDNFRVRAKPKGIDCPNDCANLMPSFLSPSGMTMQGASGGVHREVLTAANLRVEPPESSAPAG